MTAPTCPNCAGEVLPVLFGLPTEAAHQAAAAGKIVLAGCVVWDDDLEESWECRNCHHHFATPDRTAWLTAVETAISQHGR
ncbi:hypothetical protein ABT294_35980 [Nonomuraea sp. NPDC000554]|uniref:hypothetical protein n=1 Tax=Nonomuraea sp. NPDC000554 TaxID=3154259 RepID=UPI003327BBFD